MKASTKAVLAAAAMAAALFAAAASAQTHHGTLADRDGTRFYRLSELVPFDGVNVERRGGRIVGMSVLLGDGSWLPLRAQGSPACPASCPSGQQPSCWEDEGRSRSICLCESPAGGSAGSGSDRVTLIWAG